MRSKPIGSFAPKRRCILRKQTQGKTPALMTQCAAKFLFRVDRCMLDGSRLHTITAEASVVWNASKGLVQLLDGDWFQKRNVFWQLLGHARRPTRPRGQQTPFCPNRLTHLHEGRWSGSEHTSLSGNLAKRSGNVGAVHVSVQFANTCPNEEHAIRRRQDPLIKRLCCSRLTSAVLVLAEGGQQSQAKLIQEHQGESTRAKLRIKRSRC